MVTRPVLRYFGGKWNLAARIIAHFPVHRTYVEPCGGGAAVLLQKPRSGLEIYNDIYGDVVNFFRVLRDRPNELIRAIKLTPWARDELAYCWNRADDDDLENARRFFASAWMSMTSSPFTPGAGFRTSTYADQSYSTHVKNYCDMVDKGHLMAVADRLRGVQIENKDYKDIITRHDREDTLIYLDPPYVSGTRVSKNVYKFEWDDDKHIEAAGVMNSIVGYGIVSGYACDLYKRLYEDVGWMRVDFDTRANGGGDGVDSIWMSPSIVGDLGRFRQLDMFGG